MTWTLPTRRRHRTYDGVGGCRREAADQASFVGAASPADETAPTVNRSVTDPVEDIRVGTGPLVPVQAR